MLSISSATEGYPDEIVVTALCKEAGLEVGTAYDCHGKSNLDKKLSGYNNAAKGWYWLVLRDLDHDAECGPSLRDRLIPAPSRFMQLRIVVREIEAWLLADAEKLGEFLDIARSHFPRDPESLDHPKRELVRLASRSRKRTIKEDMVPRPRGGATEGPGYASRIAEFAENHWRPEVAAQSSDSLARCLKRLREWAQHKNNHPSSPS